MAPRSADSAKAEPEKSDVEMKDAQAAPEEAGAAEPTTTATPATSKSKDRRKSTSTPAKKLNKKGSRAKITHLDAKPGDHFFIKLKGYPTWPGIICDEAMLPQTLIKTRPVTAARVDGTYREDFADGGKRAHERTFPVMYLSTNEL